MEEREWEYCIPRRLYITKSIEGQPSASSTWLKLPQVIKEEVPVIADVA